MYVPLSSEKPPSAVRNVNEGAARNVDKPTPSAVSCSKGSNDRSLIESFPVAFPMRVWIRQKAYPAIFPPGKR